MALATLADYARAAGCTQTEMADAMAYGNHLVGNVPVSMAGRILRVFREDNEYAAERAKKSAKKSAMVPMGDPDFIDDEESPPIDSEDL